MNEELIFQVGAILNSISFTKDGGLRLGFATQELREEEKIIIQRFHQKFGYLLFKANEFQQSEVPKGQAENNKSQSKRIRNTLFRLWELDNKGMDFETFYKERTEKFIDFIKSHIDMTKGSNK